MAAARSPAGNHRRTPRLPASAPPAASAALNGTGAAAPLATVAPLAALHRRAAGAASSGNSTCQGRVSSAGRNAAPHARARPAHHSPATPCHASLRAGCGAASSDTSKKTPPSLLPSLLLLRCHATRRRTSPAGAAPSASSEVSRAWAVAAAWRR
jgi:hypothetical protein